MFIVFELNRQAITKQKKFNFYESKLFSRYGAHFGTFEPAAKLSGLALERSRVARTTWRLETSLTQNPEVYAELLDQGVTELLVHKIKNANPVACMRLQLKDWDLCLIS